MVGEASSPSRRRSALVRSSPALSLAAGRITKGMGSLGLATRLVILEYGICQERVAFPAGLSCDPEGNEGNGQSRARRTRKGGTRCLLLGKVSTSCLDRESVWWVAKRCVPPQLCLFCTCVSLLHLPDPWSPHLWNGFSNSTYLIQLLQELKNGI